MWLARGPGSSPGHGHASSDDLLSLNGKLAGAPLKLGGLPDTWMDDIEMEPVPLRKPPTPLYTAEVDLSETGGTMADVGATAAAWGAVDAVGTGGAWD